MTRRGQSLDARPHRGSFTFLDDYDNLVLTNDLVGQSHGAATGASQRNQIGVSTVSRSSRAVTLGGTFEFDLLQLGVEPVGQHFSSSADLVLHGSSLFYLSGSGSRAGARVISDPSLLTILEVFGFEREKDKAFSIFQQAILPEGVPAASSFLQKIESEHKLIWAQCALRLTQNSIVVRYLVEHQLKSLDISAASQATHQILRALQLRVRAETADSIGIQREAFERGFQALERSGLIVPARGHIDWGQLRRTKPICQNFGFGRGTPTDRYYLHKFVREIRAQVKGNTLEIGGARSNAAVFGFSQATEYHALDLHPSPQVDVTGDAHDPALCAADSFDSIVCFNVLEHCKKPWIVVENMHRWLKKGGKAFCMVPNAQRVHELPRDYWRPLPAAVESMFDLFAHSRLYVYGNLITQTASYHGIACEDLKPEELQFAHPDYPVATCIVAEK